MAKINSVKVSFGPFVSLEFEPDETEQNAAWSMYIDLSTSIATRDFTQENGCVRDALDSLHRVYHSIKSALRDLRPSKFDRGMIFASVCIDILTKHLSPFLVEWHEPLRNHEAKIRAGVGPQEHESNWPPRQDFIRALSELQGQMT